MMSYQLEWLVEARVLIVRVYGVIETLEEVRDMQRAYFQLSKDAQQPIHTIVDILGVERFPLNLRELRELLGTTDSEKFGLTLLVVNTNPLLRYTAALMLQLALPRARLRIFTALNDAIRYLQHADDTLPLLEVIAESVV